MGWWLSATSLSSPSPAHMENMNFIYLELDVAFQMGSLTELGDTEWVYKNHYSYSKY